jgi:hypothetical protein
MNPALLILIALILVVILNFLLIAYARKQLKFTIRGGFSELRTRMKESFEGSSDLDELASLVDQLDPELSSKKEISDKF